MDFIIKLMEEIALNNFDVGSSTWVDITHINHPHSFFVRPTSYRSYMSAMESRGENLTQLDLQLNMNITYYSKMLKCYCRGVIYHIDTSNNKCTSDVFASDYGFVEKSISLKNMYFPLHEQELPPLATHCQLANCEPVNGSWTDKTVDTMRYYVGNERAKLIVKGKNSVKLVVELINTCPDDIATLLALTGYTTLGYNNNLISRIPDLKQEKHYFTYKQLKLGDVIHVRTQYGKDLNSFYVTDVNDYNEYIKSINEFFAYSKQKNCLRPEDMKENKPVSVFVPLFGKYERGIIETITVPENKALVRLVDWGSVIEANVTAMKPMTEYYFRKPVISIYCAIEENKQFNTSFQKFLLPGYEFLVTIKEVGNQFDTPNIVTISPLPKQK